MLNLRSLNYRHFVIFFLVEALFFNLAWIHSYLSEMMVSPATYYSFSANLIFQYRALASIVYCAITLGCRAVQTGLNTPIDTLFGLFQIFWDFTALNIALLGIHRMFFHEPSRDKINISFVYAAMIVIWLFTYTYMFVPNRAIFSPYDFSDFAFLIMIASLLFDCRPLNVPATALIMFIGALNKETVLIFPAIYVILNLHLRNLIKTGFIAAVMAVSGFAGKYMAVAFVHYIKGTDSVGNFVENHLIENFQQFLNPLFYIAIVSFCAFLYVPIFMIRKSLDRRDLLLIAVAAGIVLIYMKIALLRELRLFSSVSVILLLILARHREVLLQRIRSLA